VDGQTGREWLSGTQIRQGAQMLISDVGRAECFGVKCVPLAEGAPVSKAHANRSTSDMKLWPPYADE
jgi:hypothetical protein